MSVFVFVFVFVSVSVSVFVFCGCVSVCVCVSVSVSVSVSLSVPVSRQPISGEPPVLPFGRRDAHSRRIGKSATRGGHSSTCRPPFRVIRHSVGNCSTNSCNLGGSLFKVGSMGG